jgi:hypothetical protein
MQQFKFFHGYIDKSLTEQWLEILNVYPPAINEWGTMTIPATNPNWVTNPGYITYTPPNYTITNTPNYYGTGYITIPCNGTINTATGFSLTTSNTNGTTYTTGGIGGTLTTGTATYSSSSFKLQ